MVYLKVTIFSDTLNSVIFKMVELALTMFSIFINFVH